MKAITVDPKKPGTARRQAEMGLPRAVETPVAIPAPACIAVSCPARPAGV